MRRVSGVLGAMSGTKNSEHEPKKRRVEPGGKQPGSRASKWSAFAEKNGGCDAGPEDWSGLMPEPEPLVA
jgi:hypothetical protein